MAGKKPNPIDIHVGQRIRMRRMLIGMSQETLGESLGVAFQQVQKYEKGVNRIGASKLYATAKALGVPVSYFFDELPPTETEAGPQPEISLAETLQSRDGIALNKAFTAIARPDIRQSVVELVRALANGAAA